METREITKDKKLYKNALGHLQPGYADAKLTDEIELLSKLDHAFAEIEGQDYACHAVKEQLFGLSNRANANGPAAIFFFAGPPAVGKTLLAQKIGEALGRPFERIDMSGYSDKEAPISLFGLNKSYKAAAPGRFTTYIKEHPVSVILFDEIEKAHVTVRNNILQMLDKGAVYDLFYEQEFSVRDCILIFTSNVGTNAYNTGDPYKLSLTPSATVIKALREEKDPATGVPYFSHELVSRFASGKVIVFNRLRPEVLHSIVVRRIMDMLDDYYREYRIGSRIDVDAIADLILLSQGGDVDVRSAVRAVKEFFTRDFERMVEMVSRGGNGGRIGGIRYHIDRSTASLEVKKLLSGDGSDRVFRFGGVIERNIPKKLRGNIEVIAADDIWSIRDIQKLDPMIAFVCVTKRNRQEAKMQFENLVAAGVATYVYTKDENISLADYKEGGAVDCFTPHSPISFGRWAADAVRGIGLGRASRQLFRANKVITFSSSYQYSQRRCVVDVTLSDLAMQIAYDGGERSLFIDRAAIPDVTFADIIGAEEAKRELEPAIRQLKNFHEYQKRGIRIPRGIIFDGPPGSGKTSLAKAVANAAGLPFISLNATQFLSRWVGEGEQKIRDIFAAARRYAPSLLFIDEIDCIAKNRMGGGADSFHTEGLTNALLSELDGFGSQDAAPVFVIAATNYDTHSADGGLDQALLRRFDKKIHIDLPKVADRERFIVRELAKYDFCTVSRAVAEGVAKRSVGWSLADLNLVIQNAIRHSESESGFLLTDAVLEEAFASFNAGGRKTYDEQTVRKIAYHEAGHAVVARVLGFRLAYTTIVARGNCGGYMQYAEEEKLDLSRDECLNRICVVMAGRAAEVCFYKGSGITTGAGEDIRSATDMAVRMICIYGMEEDMLCRMEPVKAVENAAVYKRVQDILSREYGRAIHILREKADRVEIVANALLKRESLTENELLDII